jgi:hypothetical protein
MNEITLSQFKRMIMNLLLNDEDCLNKMIKMRLEKENERYKYQSYIDNLNCEIKELEELEIFLSKKD